MYARRSGPEVMSTPLTVIRAFGWSGNFLISVGTTSGTGRDLEIPAAADTAPAASFPDAILSTSSRKPDERVISISEESHGNHEA